MPGGYTGKTTHASEPDSSWHIQTERGGLMETLIRSIQDLAIPFFLVIIFYFSCKLAGGVTGGEGKNLRSAKSGIWAGLVVLVLFGISVFPPTGDPPFNPKCDSKVIDCDLDIREMVTYPAVGFLVGVGMLWGIGRLQPRPNQDKKPHLNWDMKSFLLGVAFLIAVTATTIGLYGYIFIPRMQIEIAFITCGVLLGALVLLIYDPDVVYLG